MKISRLYTTADSNVYDMFDYTLRSSTLRNPDGSVVFSMENIEVPSQWSQMATDILAQKYFRKAGVPMVDEAGNQLYNEEGEPILGSERSARQVVHRLAGCWRHWGEEHGYFDTEEDAQAFYDEIAYMLLNQMCAPNSPQWFNTGLNWAYGITGPAQGHYFVDPESGKLTRSKDAYTHPAPHACFIQSVEDDLVNEGGIFDLVTREARIFKYGSGCTAGESRIYVSGEGFIPIADLFEKFRAEGRPVVDFDGKGRYIEIADAGLDTISVNEKTGAYQRDRIVRVWSYDVAAEDKLSVSFDSGARSTVSAWHPFLVWNGSEIVERRADQLKRGDGVIGPNSTAYASLPSSETVVSWKTTYFRKEENWSLSIDEDIAWLIGYFMGDGSLGRSKGATTNKQGKTYRYDRLRLRFHDETTEVLDRVRAIVAGKFDEHATIQQDGRGSNGKHLCYTGRRVTRFFEELFGVGPKTYALRMPDFVRTASRSHVMAFLAGLIDSDGTVSEGRACYSTASSRFAEDLAVLVSLHGLGGGTVESGGTTSVTMVHRSTLLEARRELAGNLAHPVRRARLLRDDRPHERAFCMPLDVLWRERLFGGGHPAGDWLAMPVGEETFHLGRLHYEGIVNPVKVRQIVEEIDRDRTGVAATREELDFINRVAESITFVTGVEECQDDPEFFDLTVAEHSNYLAGERGLVAIHNTGSNFSNLRGEGEPLSGGGVSSGLMSFLKINDRAAGAVKSGGTTRRAAKMVILNADHPDIEKFIDWKMVEEQKVAAMVAGSKVCSTFLEAISNEARLNGTDFSQPDTELHSLVQRALSRGIPFNYIARVLALVDQGIENIDFREYDLHYEGEAYNTVSGQNSNNSIRLSNDFMKKVKEDADWGLTSRITGETMRTVKARYLWNKINYAAWSSADPGLQYDTTINEWHTSPKEGRINGSNPCVTADTFVTTDRGLERIGNLIGEARGVKSIDGSLHWVEQIFPTGTKPVYELKTKSGYRMKLTADHQVFTENRGDVQACELTKDDLVRLMPGEFGTESTGAGDTAALIGLLVGDGCITQQNIYTADGERREVAFLTCGKEEEAIASWANEIVNGLRPEFSDKQKIGAVLETPTSLRVQAGSPRMLELFREFAVLDEKSDCKRLTDRAFRLNREEQGALLRGLFTADGTVANFGEKSQYVALDSTSLELLTQVQLMLLNFGIKTKIYEHRRAGNTKAMLPDGKGGMKEYPVKEMHSLRVSRSSRVLFEKEINFLPESPKCEQLRKLNETVSTYADHLVDPIASLEYLGEEPVFDLTEPETSHFTANGIIVHNCSEYLYLDDTACNLASLNLSHFYNSETGVFDVESFKHGSRLWTVVLEISVLMAQFPSKIIAQKSFETRTLGLGYANLGTVLMTAGIPYDSDEGRNWAAAITAVMCGEAYATSAELARDKGAFAKYKRNAKDMLRVIRNHRRAAYNAPEGEYEGLTVTPVGLKHELCPENLANAAKETWDRALELGEEYGYRNAQVTVIAPTGTISLVMDCDTTGIEPDFALVKYKKLAGGGYFKIVNQSVAQALVKLGYSDAEIDEITGYIRGYASLRNCPHINRASLKERGFTDEKVDAIEDQLETVFDIGFAFNHHTLGEEFLETLGFDPEEAKAPNFNLLEALGFTKEEVAAANRHVCGTMTIEGAPGLKEEHLPIFDCANRCGRDGKRYIDYMGHVKMMAAAQPFISGAISKTINMPREATLDDVERVYMESWRLMVKAIALYRDGSKLSQPLNVSSDTELVDQVTLRDIDVDAMELVGEENDWNENMSPAHVQEKIVEKVYHRADRRRLPKRRHGFVREANVGGHKVFLRTGEYEDGKIGEIFIDMYKEGASFKGLLNCFAVLASKALQYGMPLEKMVDTFTFTRFEPAGAVQGHEAIKNATSIIDYVFRAIGYEYLGREDFIHVKAVDETEGIEYGSDDEKDLPAAKLSPGQELWERQKNHRRRTNGNGTAKGASNGSTNGNGKASTNGNGSPASAVAAARSVMKESVVSEVEAKVATAKAHGYTGEQCGNCGSMRVKQNGACHVCEECGTTSGCS